MTTPFLESIAQSLNYGDLPETWRVPRIERFSPQKSLYDYQADALRNAARALYLYYGKGNGWQPTELSHGKYKTLSIPYRRIKGGRLKKGIRRYDN